MSRARDLAGAVAEALKDAGTRVAFGVPGGGNNLDLVGALDDAGIRFVLTHTETAAGIMASVDGDLTPGPGACLVTRGPGAASLVNGIAQAQLDRSPVLAVADTVPSRERARISHQRIDQTALFRPISKWAGTIGAAGAPASLRAAVELAEAAPQGAVVLDFDPDGPSDTPPRPTAHGAAQLDRARALLQGARRPVVLLGVGARGTAGTVRELLEGAPWPVLTTYRAKGLIPETWPNAAGLLTGATIELRVLRAADLVVAIGVDPVELIPGPWPVAAPVVAFDEWPIAEPYLRPAAAVVGPLGSTLQLVADHLARDFDGHPPGRDDRLHDEAALHEAQADGIGPQHVVLAARAAAPADATATVDSGAHMLVAMPLWEVTELDQVAISSGLATMGFSLPAAIAASLARPGRQVVAFSGDGGLGMCLAELETLARLELPVTVVVFDDSALSLIEIKQRAGQGGRSAVRYAACDLAAVARGLGLASRRVERRDELPAAFAEAFAAPRPFLLDVRVDPSGYPQVMAAIRG